MPRVAVYFGEDDEFLILPISKAESGWWREVNKPERLQWDGTSVVALGEKVLRCWALSPECVGPPDGATPAFMLATGVKSHRAFARTRQLVFLDTNRDESEMVVEFLRRDANFMYSASTDDPKD